MRRLFPALAVGCATLAFAWACSALVSHPSLASFADDSVSYLVMAQVFSPWRSAAPAVADAFAHEAFYPPLFPLLLAWSGVAHDFAKAHAEIALTVAAMLPLTYVLGSRWLSSTRAAAAATIALALVPAMWINAMGILSEPLYGVLLLAMLLALESDLMRSRTLWIVAALMAAMALTRTAALGLAAGYALWALSRREHSFRGRLRAALPTLAAVLVCAAWLFLRPAGPGQGYEQIIAERAHRLGSSPQLATLATMLGRQLNAMLEAWTGSVLLFWVEGRMLRVALAVLVGCAAFAGMALRVRARKPDAWIMAGYLATYLAWPFYDQMGRFLFPAVPVLVLYAFVAVEAALRALARPAVLGYGLLAVLIASLAVPGLLFIQRRAEAGGPYSGVIDWYRTPNLEIAKSRSQVHLDLFADMAWIRAHTAPAARVMWVAPAYIALLADRTGVRTPQPLADPDAYRRAMLQEQPDYVFVSLYHPRDTLSDAAWLAGVRALYGHAQVVNVRAHGDGTLVTSMLFGMPSSFSAAKRP